MTIRLIISSLLGVLLGCLAIIFVSFTLHIMIQKADEMGAALISRYKFGSFRIFYVAIAKYNEGFRIMMFSIPGTAGHCLMEPPL